MDLSRLKHSQIQINHIWTRDVIQDLFSFATSSLDYNTFSILSPSLLAKKMRINSSTCFLIIKLVSFQHFVGAPFHKTQTTVTKFCSGTCLEFSLIPQKSNFITPHLRLSYIFKVANLFLAARSRDVYTESKWKSYLMANRETVPAARSLIFLGGGGGVCIFWPREEFVSAV